MEPTAYHEAGHAVMALILGRPVQFVTIRPDREHLGICEFGKPLQRPSEDWLEREMLIALAGPAAEAIHAGDYDWAAAGKDHAYALELAVRRAGKPRQAERLEKRVLAKAEHLLSRPAHWRAVERLAKELLLHQDVSGRTARHIVEDEVRKADQ